MNLNEQLTAITAALPALLPELVLAGAFVLVLLVGLVQKPIVKLLMPLLALAALSVFCLLTLFHHPVAEESSLLMHGMLRVDGVARYAALLMGISGLLTFVLAHFYQPLKTREKGLPEFVLLVLAMVLGLSLMVKAGNLLLLYLAIELVSFSSYILTALFRDRKVSAEAGLKYVLFGAMASGVMIYGMSFLYGFSGSLSFTDPAFGEALVLAPNGLVAVGVVLTFAGLFFKAGAAPLHIWSPDVYEGAPTPIAALFSTAPKIAAVVVLARLLPALPGNIWVGFTLPLLSAAAIASLVVGNFGALRQFSLKRLMAYSGIAHTGFLLMPLLGAGDAAVTSLLFYASAYLLFSFGAFALIQAVEGNRETSDLADWAGLGGAMPLLGVSAVVIMVALTGLPPTAGFTGKLLVFSSVWEQFEKLNSAWLLWVLGAGILLTVVSLFYYLRIPYTMFFKGQGSDITLRIGLQEQLLIAGLAFASLFFFFQAEWLMELVQWVVERNRV